MSALEIWVFMSLICSIAAFLIVQPSNSRQFRLHRSPPEIPQFLLAVYIETHRAILFFAKFQSSRTRKNMVHEMWKNSAAEDPAHHRKRGVGWVVHSPRHIFSKEWSLPSPTRCNLRHQPLLLSFCQHLQISSYCSLD